MSNPLEEAMDVLRSLPNDRQEAAARAIINYGNEEDAAELSDEQVEEIERRTASPDRKFITLAELDKRIRRCGMPIPIDPVQTLKSARNRGLNV